MREIYSKLFRWPYVLVAMVVILGASAKMTHSYLVEKNEQLVHSVAQTLLPALLTNDTEQIAEVLKSLESYPGIERVELVGSEGATIVSFARNGDSFDLTSDQFALASAEAESTQLQLAAPVTFDSLILANLHIAVNLWPSYMRIMSWVGTLLIVPSVLYVFFKSLRVRFRFERSKSANVVNDEVLRGFDLSQVMQETMEEAQISVEYQPIQRLRDGGLYGYELVVCWNHPSGQTLHLSPAIFQRLSQKWGLMLPVSEWLIQSACMVGARWQRDFGPLVMSFNISMEQLASEEFPATVRRICEETQFPHQLIEFEIDEAVIAKHPNTSHQIVSKFLDQGFNLTIDQFGLSSGSINLLDQLPSQKVKFDAKLLRKLENDVHVQMLVNQLCIKAQDLGINAMADGLETDAQRELMQKAGCIYGQGRLTGLPMTASQFEAMLEMRNASGVLSPGGLQSQLFAG